jgi:asparagine synthase (glutamine-hydrolysing)
MTSGLEGAVSPADDYPIHGSPTCARLRYLSVVRGQLVSASDIREILQARYAAGVPIEVDHAAISHLLHDGFVPQPRTVYRDIYVISVDLSARQSDGGIAFRRDYPYENRKSSCSGLPSTGTLLAHLAESVQRSCEDSRGGMLLLSSGLDSTSVAVAMREAGRRDIVCVTYGDSDDAGEVEHARAVCAKLGLRHQAHIFESHSAKVTEDLRDYAAGAVEPCADPALTAVVSAVTRFANSGGVVLDGSGSDYFFWRPPKPLDLFKTRLGLGKIRILRRLRDIIPMHVRRERILATPLELLLLNGAWLRFSDSSRFYPEAVNTHDYWLQESLAASPYEREEMQHCLKMVYMGPAAFMMKTRNAAMAVGAAPRFPWTDSAVADYCFSLPEAARFDRRRRRSKTIVRQMLKEMLGYDSDQIGKHHFHFGKHRFLEHHLAFCREEIMSCSLWSRKIEKTFQKLADMLAVGRPSENALISLLMVSLWHNHWIQGSMMDTLRGDERRIAGAAVG